MGPRGIEATAARGLLVSTESPPLQGAGYSESFLTPRTAGLSGLGDSPGQQGWQRERSLSSLGGRGVFVFKARGGSVQ